MQRILVCAQDPVLAKKVRFLMERDECKVEILASPDELELRLADGSPTLLVLSREIGSDDAIELVGRIDAEHRLPSTLVLGGSPRVVPDFVHLVPDPVDTQAIYREASRLLQTEREPAPEPATDAMGTPLDELEALETLEPLDDEDIALSDEDALGGIAEELGALEAAEMDEKLSDAFAPVSDDEAPVLDPFPAPSSEPAAEPIQPTPPEEKPVTETPPPSPAPAAPQGASPNAQALEPAGFARTLHGVWRRAEGGAIVVDREGERATLCFEDGRPVAALSSLPGEPLGRALVARGRLSDAQYADAAKRVVETGSDLGDAIVELGFLGEEDLASEMGTSARERLVACFSARDGEFWRDPDTHAPEGRRFRLEVGHIIAQGLRSHADDAVIEGILGDRLSSYFRLRRPAFDLQKDFPLSKADMDFLAYGGRAYNLEDAADGAGLPLSEARRLLAILAVAEEVDAFVPTAREFESLQRVFVRQTSR